MFRAVGACLVWVASGVSLGREVDGARTSELYYEGNIFICEQFVFISNPGITHFPFNFIQSRSIIIFKSAV